LNRVVASAPGKVILFGEHAVVYGEPAIAAAIRRRVYVSVEEIATDRIEIESRNLKIRESMRLEKCTRGELEGVSAELKPLWHLCHKMLELHGHPLKHGLRVEIRSEIPESAGLGSSAALATALALALKEIFSVDMSPNDIWNIAFESEKIVHGRPSGIDNTLSLHGGVILYRKGSMKRIRLGQTIPLVVGDTGVSRSTGKMVARVRMLREKYPDVIEEVIRAIGRLSLLSVQALVDGDLEKLGDLMNINQGLLEALGVSSPEISMLVNAARKAGALGAKLTGAGGGGCIIALPAKNAINNVVESIKRVGRDAFLAEIEFEGARIESGGAHG